MKRFRYRIAAIVVVGVLGLVLWLRITGFTIRSERPVEETREFTPIIREAEGAVGATAPTPDEHAGLESGHQHPQVLLEQGDSYVAQLGEPYKALVSGLWGDPVSPALVRDGPVAAADLCFPTSVAVGPKGEVYVAEPHSALVRVIAAGRVSTLIPTVPSKTPGSTTPLAFERPARVVVQGEYLYVLDDIPNPGLPSPVARTFVRSRLWKVHLASRQATLLATPDARDRDSLHMADEFGLSPDYVWAMSAADEKGLLLFLWQRSKVMLVSPRGFSWWYLSLSERALGALLGDAYEDWGAPYFASWGLAALPDGRLAIAHGTVVAIAGGRGGLQVLAGNPGQRGNRDGVGKHALFSEATGMVWDQRRRALIVADAGNNTIRAVTLQGQVTTVAGGGSITPEQPSAEGAAGKHVQFFPPTAGKDAEFFLPTDLCVAPDGSILVADSGYNLIRRIAPNGTVTVFAGTGRRYVVPVPYPGRVNLA